MKLAPFLLDQWLELKFTHKIQYDLASSTGPHWTLQQLDQLLDPEERRELFQTELVYSNAPGNELLRQRIAEFCGVNAGQVQVVTGASEALLILFFHAAEPNANIVLPFPLFPPVAEVPKALGLEIRYYTLHRENGYRADLEEIKKLTDQNTRIIFVNTPHNPTGTVMSYEELMALYDFAAERGIQFVVDEVYHPLYHNSSPPSAATLPHATVIGDFSKALCLSGLRIGWIIERDPHRLEKYLDTRSYFTISNSPVTELLAAFALRNSEKILEPTRELTLKNLKLLDSFFAENSQCFGWVRPEGGTTCFPWLVSGNDARPFCKALMSEGVFLAPGDCFGIPSHFRLGFGACSEGFDIALKKISNLVRSAVKV